METHVIQSPSDTSPQRPPEDHGRKPPETNAPAEKEEWPDLLPVSWKIPSAEHRWYERENDFTPEEKKRAWDETAKIVKDYSDELVKRWKEEIDTLLVYAGLFSAVLTALIVESYKLLSPPPPDPVLAALQQISVQLSSLSVNPPFINSTQPSVSQVLPPAPPAPRWAVWLNALWFSSLIFSLSAASVGIMVKQWLNEYSTGLLGDSRRFARLRQHRLQNLEKWHVAEIVAILPLLLQIALVLFFGGLLILLWGLNSDVAAVASALIGLLFAFTIGTLLIPVFRADCCYLSPPVYVFFAALRPVKAAAFQLHRLLWIGLCCIRIILRCSDDGRNAFSEWETKNRKGKPWAFTWRGRELHQISKSSNDLDATMVMKAYATTMDQSYLDDYATICFSDFPNPSQAGDCYRGLVSEMDRHQQDKADIPLTIRSDLWLAIKYAPEYIRHFHKTGLPDMHRFWEDTYDSWRIPTGASHWRNHLWANVLTEGNTSAYKPLCQSLIYDYDLCSNEIRQCAVRVIEQELRKHGQKADNESLKRCSWGLSVLLDWVGASSSANNAEEIEMAKVIRALTRHGLLCHFKCCTTEAGKTPLLDVNTIFVIRKLRRLCEDRGPDFMTAELVDALVRVYEVHQDIKFHPFLGVLAGLLDSKPWIMKLKSERDESTKNDHVQTGIPLAEAQLSAAAEDRRDPTAAAQVSVAEQPHSNTHTSLVQDVHAEETEKEIATNTPSPVLSSSSD